VQAFGVVSETSCRFLLEQRRELQPERAEGDGSYCRVLAEIGRAEARSLRPTDVRRDEAGLVFAELDWSQPIVEAQSFRQGLEYSCCPLGHRELNPAQPRRGRPRGGQDPRFVDRDLAGEMTVRLNGKEVTVSTDLEQRQERLSARDRPDTIGDRTSRKGQ
jgi:hypothetical protein